MEVQTKDLESSDLQGGLGTLDMSLMCNTKKPLWVTCKTYIMYSSLYVLKGLVGMLVRGIYGILLVKKFRNMENRYVRIWNQCPLFKNIDNDFLSGNWMGVNFDIFFVKNKMYNIIMMSTNSGIVVYEGKNE